MKSVSLMGLAVVITLTGCQTEPRLSSPEKITVQMVEIECDPALMKGAWPSRIWFMDLATLRDIGIKDDPNSYICEMDLNTCMGEQAYTNFYDARPTSTAAERLRTLPAVKATELPPIHLSAGERGIDDDSEITEYAVDFDIVEGETVVTMKQNLTVGRVIEVELLEAGVDRARVETLFHLGKVRGYDQYTLSNGDEIRMPLFEAQSRHTEYSLPYDTWVLVGSLLIEAEEQSETERVHMLVLKNSH